MYGEYNSPFELTFDDISIILEECESGFTYTRTKGEDITKKNIMGDDISVYISPVEPLNIPMKLTSALLIELDEPIIVQPNIKRQMYLTFPLEIGFFLKKQVKQKPFDLFSVSKPKYTLYGDVKTGTICKYWKSDVYSSVPKTDLAREGVLELSVKNVFGDWIEVHHIAFNAYGMKIYFDEEGVSMRSKVFIKAENVSVTDFVDKPLRKGMQRGIEVFTKDRRPLIGTRFVMEAGL